MNDVLDLTCYRDGQFLPLKFAGPSLLDFGFIHSDATYDVMTVRNGKLFLQDYHIERFQQSAAFFDLRIPSKDEILAICKKVCDLNKITNGFVWLMSWRGTPVDGNPRNLISCPHHFVVYAKPYYNFNASNTAKVALYKDHVRISDKSFGQQYKNFAWQDLTLAQRYADSKGADTAIMYNDQGMITEGPGFGVGFIFGDTITIPQNDVLHSVTLRCLEDICKKNNIKFVKRDIPWKESLLCTAMFLASTSGGIITVSEYEGKKFLQNRILEKVQDEYRFLQNS